MKKQTGYISALIVFVLLASCSTKENTMSSRFYHAFTARYNIYYNGKTSFDESFKALQNGNKDNYTEQLLMYPISAKEKNKKTTGGPFDRAIEKSEKAIKLHTIKTKPPKKQGWKNDPKEKALQEKEEYNPFLKKCWLMLGQSQFYNADFLQASSTFSYISRHYAGDEEMVAESKLWQARSYSEMGWLYEAEDILNKLNINGIPQKKQKLYAAFFADYLIKNRQNKEAIPYLITAIKAEKNHLQRLRMKYLLGQLYADQGLDGLAYKMFGQVARSNPPYEMEFSARIRQTEVFPGENYVKVIRKLEGMARSEKNKEYQDQVYYAIGNVWLSQLDTAKAIANYEKSIEKSTRNGLDKALCQIKLGDLYFMQRNYEKAQPCFSGALFAITKTHRDYQRVAKLSAVLDELVVHVQAVHLQDSLQTVAKMSEQERMKLINNKIEEVKKAEEKQKAEAEKAAFLVEQGAKGTGINRAGTETKVVTLPTASGESSFYFYNPQLIAEGKRQFQNKWGRRILEDDWRRLKKVMNTFQQSSSEAIAGVGKTNKTDKTDSQAGTAPSDTLSSPVASQNPKDPAYYLQQLPFSKEDIQASDLIIEDGLYNMAKIYQNKLEDLPLAIETFETLERRFPGNEHRLDSYYQLYLMGMRLNNPGLSELYKNKLIQTFPQSDYAVAVAVADPNYAYNMQRMDHVQDSTYEATYNSYLAGDTTQVRKLYREVAKTYPLSKLMSKFMFLEALTYVQSGNTERFKESLKTLVDKYPKEDVSGLAGEMLKGVLRGRALMKDNIKGMKWNLRFGLDDNGMLAAEDSARKFTAGINEPYRMLLIYPTESIEKNQLLFTIAAYNFANFMVKEFDLSTESFGELSMLSIKGFVGMEEILQYYRMIHQETGYAKTISESVGILPISETNYETLIKGKTLDEYIAFFETSFGKMAPEIVNRWRARLSDDTNKISVPRATEEKAPQDHPITPVKQPVTEISVSKTDSLKSDGAITLPKTIVVDTATVVGKESIKEPIQIQTGTNKKSNVQATDSVTPVAVPEAKELTLKDIKEIRAREAAEEEVRKKEQRKEFETQQKTDKGLQEQKDKERADILKKQQEEDQALLKAKAAREKALEKEQKEQLKRTEAARKQKIKDREALLKQKEREYKQQLKQREAERKEKEKLYQQKLRDREKAQRETKKKDQ